MWKKHAKLTFLDGWVMVSVMMKQTQKVAAMTMEIVVMNMPALVSQKQLSYAASSSVDVILGWHLRMEESFMDEIQG